MFPLWYLHTWDFLVGRLPDVNADYQWPTFTVIFLSAQRDLVSLFISCVSVIGIYYWVVGYTTFGESCALTLSLYSFVIYWQSYRSFADLFWSDFLKDVWVAHMGIVIFHPTKIAHRLSVVCEHRFSYKNPWQKTKSFPPRINLKANQIHTPERGASGQLKVASVLAWIHRVTLLTMRCKL